MRSTHSPAGRISPRPNTRLSGWPMDSDLTGARVDARTPSSDISARHPPVSPSQKATRRVTAAFGAITVRIDTWGEVLSSVALDPLRHAIVDPSTPVDLSLLMLDGKETGIEAEALTSVFADRARGADIAGRSLTLTVNDELQTRCLVDAPRQRVAVWFADAATAPEWLIYDQIRNALHLASHDRNFGLFHAAALRYAGTGCLITGKSGSGKSTLTAAAVTHGFEMAGDDFVLIETLRRPRVHAVFDTIKLDERGLAKFPRYRPFVRNPGRGAEHKAIVHAFDAAPDQIATGFSLDAILHARLSGDEQSRIVASTASAAYLALAPSTTFLLRTRGREVGTKCMLLAGCLPAYAFEIGTDLDAAVAALAAFMRELRP